MPSSDALRALLDRALDPFLNNIPALSPGFPLRLCGKIPPDAPYMPEFFRFASLGNRGKSSRGAAATKMLGQCESLLGNRSIGKIAGIFDFKFGF
jgi:hypothetical protein